MPEDFKGFLSLKGRVWAECAIELGEPLHIGAGKDPTAPIDLPVLRNAKGVPIIPGSTLKGFFRSYLSRLLYGYKLAGGTRIEVEEAQIDIGNCVDSVAEDMEDLAELGELCILDRIFGYAGSNISLASVIKFTDATSTNIPTSESTLKRTHVKIDRIRDATERGMLVNVEAVKEHSKEYPTSFKFTIVFDELGDEYYKESNKLFYFLLHMLYGGMEAFLGGWKSRGYGKVKIKLEKVKYFSISDLLLERQPREISGDPLKQWIIEKMQGG